MSREINFCSFGSNFPFCIKINYISVEIYKTSCNSRGLSPCEDGNRPYTWCDNKVRELIAVKVLHTSLLNTTAVALKVLPLGSCASMSAPSPPFKEF